MDASSSWGVSRLTPESHRRRSTAFPDTRTQRPDLLLDLQRGVHTPHGTASQDGYGLRPAPQLRRATFTALRHPTSCGTRATRPAASPPLLHWAPCVRSLCAPQRLLPAIENPKACLPPTSWFNPELCGGLLRARLGVFLSRAPHEFLIRWARVVGEMWRRPPHPSAQPPLRQWTKSPRLPLSVVCLGRRLPATPRAPLEWRLRLASAHRQGLDRT